MRLHRARGDGVRARARLTPRRATAGRLPCTQWPRPARRLLAERFGFADFRPGQEQVIDAAARRPLGARRVPDRRRQVPLLPAAGAAARRADARRLAADRADEGPDRRAHGRGVAAARLDSSLDARRGARRSPTRHRARATLRLLYVAPERFNNERFLALLEPHADRAVRRRRGALHLRVGPQLPARLPEAGAPRARARRRARAGADRHRDAAGACATSAPASASPRRTPS